MKRSELKRYSRLKGSRSGKTVVCAADGCENEFYRYPSHATKFCSRECAYRSKPPMSDEQKELRREKMKDRRGDRNPNWKHGRKVGVQDRELARVFNLRAKGGERLCRVCLSPENVQLHHVIPRDLGTKESRLDLRNGLQLCASHHQQWHRGVRCVPRSVFTEEEWSYLISVQLTGRQTIAWLEDHYPANPLDGGCA